jgi:hypothetical protein
VRAFCNGVRITLKEELPEDIHLKWRIGLLRKMRTVIKPGQRVEVRDIRKRPVCGHLASSSTMAVFSATGKPHTCSAALATAPSRSRSGVT